MYIITYSDINDECGFNYSLYIPRQPYTCISSIIHSFDTSNKVHVHGTCTCIIITLHVQDQINKHCIINIHNIIHSTCTDINIHSCVAYS